MAFIVGFAQLVFLFNLIWSIRNGREAGGNPWRATSLEWQTPETPPAHGNFGKELPVVYRWAYDYSVPGAKEDFIPQNDPGVYAGLQGTLMSVILVFLLVIAGIAGWWLSQQRLMSKPWLEQGNQRGIPRHRVRHDAGGEGRRSAYSLPWSAACSRCSPAPISCAWGCPTGAPCRCRGCCGSTPACWC